MASNLKNVSATGVIKTGKGVLKSVALQGGSANSTVSVRDDTSGSGTVILSLAAVIGNSATWTAGDRQGVPFVNGIHVTLAGTGAAVSVEYE